MKEPYTSLETSNVDDYIDRVEQSFFQVEAGEEAHAIRDLHYLYHKQEILGRARQRLMPDDLSQMQIVQADSPGAVHFERAERPMQPFVSPKRRVGAWSKLVAGLAAALLLLGAIFGASQFFDAHSQPATGKGATGSASATSAATSTSANTILFSDSLSQNTHGWMTDTQHFFHNGAYYINNLSNSAAISLLPDFTADAPWSYSLTMTQVQGDVKSSNNTFGVLFGYTATQDKHEKKTHFYSLVFTNGPGAPVASLFDYDNTRTYPWVLFTTVSVSLHQQLGVANIIKITASNNVLMLTVNGKSIDRMPLPELGKGRFGMLVNLKGSEVAFQNLLITRP